MTADWTQVDLEVACRGIGDSRTIRRVSVSLSDPVRIASSGETRRRLSLALDSGATSSGLVESRISWDAVLAHVGQLLAFEAENRKQRREASS